MFRHFGVNVRHGILLHTLAMLARLAGYTVDMEPPPEGKFVQRSYYRKGNAAYGSGLRPDLLLIDEKGVIALDVSVTHPASKSHARASSRHACSAANIRARQKHTKYGHWVHKAIDKEAKFLAFVFESFGACSEGVRRCIDLLAAKACSLALCSFEEFRSYAMFELSTALQHGNAEVTRNALQRFRRHRPVSRVSPNPLVAEVDSQHRAHAFLNSIL